jgi:hypothetical protein
MLNNNYCHFYKCFTQSPTFFTAFCQHCLSLFNDLLSRLGLHNAWKGKKSSKARKLKGLSPAEYRIQAQIVT